MGKASRDFAKEFRLYLREKGLSGKVRVNFAGIDTAPEKIVKADLIVFTPYIGGKGFREYNLRLAPDAKTQEILYTKSGAQIDFQKTFEEILKKVGLEQKKKA